MDLSDLMILRGAERLLVVAIAGLSIVLGYHLFKIVPVDKDSRGEFKALNISIVVSKVGPGVFFAAFGALVLGLSVMTQLKVEPGQQGASVPQSGEMTQTALLEPRVEYLQQAPAPELAPQVAYAPVFQPIAPNQVTYLGVGGAPSASVEDVNRIKDQIGFLNCAAEHAGIGLDPGLADAMRSAVDAASTALLRGAWQADWGDPASLDNGNAVEAVNALLAAKSSVCLAAVLKVEAN